MRLLSIVIAAIFMTGAVLWYIGASKPVYTDPNAPERLSRELQNKPRDERFREWHQELSRYETPHKKLTDMGRGIMALAAGLFLAMVATSLYGHFTGRERITFFIIAWLGLWALKVPFSMWYYQVRAKRFDYPVWGDSTAIGVASDAMAWVVLAIVSSFCLLLLMIRRRLPSKVRLVMPVGWWGWTRAVLLGLWILLLLYCIRTGMLDGDEGMVISCLGALPLLVAVLGAVPASSTTPSASSGLFPSVQPSVADS